MSVGKDTSSGATSALDLKITKLLETSP